MVILSLDKILWGGGRDSIFLKGNLLEVGCSYGYNLEYLHKEYGYDCYGVEPSEKAICFGGMKYPELHLVRGTADKLEFCDSYFSVVSVGFCLYQVDRMLLSRVFAEVDRVLKEGGIIILTDFDVPINCVRENIHTPVAPTFKTDYARFFCEGLGYSLIDKRVYSHAGDYFVEDIQERVSTQILYKEHTKDLYMEKR